MKPSTLVCVCSAVLLAGCLPKTTTLASVGSDSRYSIDAYKESTTLTSDLTGLWMAIHNGTLYETSDGVDYTVTGNIREIVEVTKSGSVFYVRSCLKPEIKNVVSISSNDISFAINDEQAQLTKTSFTAMSGTAAHSTSGSSYSGTLKMKKVLPLNDTFGLFNYLNTSLGKDVATAGCFQEASLHVVGSKLGFSKWSDVEFANITDWSAATFHQTGYMFSRAGTADAVKKVRFMEGSIASGATVREYPAGNETVSVATSSSTSSAYTSSFSVGGVISGTTDLSFAIAAPVASTGTTTTSAATSTTTTSAYTPGSFDFLSMVSWMTGIFNILIPW